MLPAVFEPAAATSERPQTHALHRSATGIGMLTYCLLLFINTLINIPYRYTVVRAWCGVVVKALRY
jgi:hypothetical protein